VTHTPREDDYSVVFERSVQSGMAKSDETSRGEASSGIPDGNSIWLTFFKAPFEVWRESHEELRCPVCGVQVDGQLLRCPACGVSLATLLAQRQSGRLNLEGIGIYVLGLIFLAYRFGPSLRAVFRGAWSALGGGR